MPPHSPSLPFSSTSGPRPCKLLLLGESWGESESIIHKPFAGESGKLLFDMLGEAMPNEFPELHAAARAMYRYGLAWVRPRDAWLEACGIAMTNVLAFRPPNNQLESICGDKKSVGNSYVYSPASRGKYLLPEYLGELTRLEEEIRGFKPNLVLALGNTALWALLNVTNIGSVRGAIAGSIEEAAAGAGGGIKVLPTYHPAGVLRQWGWRPIVVADLMKAWREAQFPDIRRPARQINISPTLAELEQRVAQTLANPPALMPVDIETGYGQIKCIGFGTSRNAAFIIPFMDQRQPGWHYWQYPGEELRAWQLVKQLLESDIPKLGQNFLYDLQYIMRLGIMPRNCEHDTMLLHHSHFPEMKKGLGFLGSIYTDEPAWKLMNANKEKTQVARLKGLEATLKRDA